MIPAPVHADFFMLALCLYREASGDGPAGMTAVGCVVRNRVHRRQSGYYVEVVRRLQFSSITDPKDPQLVKYPSAFDEDWKLAQSIAEGIILDVIQDTTNGSTMYYAPVSMTQGNIAPKTMLLNGKQRVIPKTWDMTKIKFQAEIGKQLYFTEA